MLPQKEITFDRFIRWIISAGAVIAVLYLLNKLSGVLLPFFVAWIVAYLTYPMVIFFQHKLHFRSRVVSILTVMLLLGIIVTCAALFFIPPMIEEFIRLKELLVSYLTNYHTHSSIPEAISRFVRSNIDVEWIKTSLDTKTVLSAVQEIVPRMWTLIATSYNIVAAIFAGFIMILYYFFILLDYEQIAGGWITLIEPRHRDKVLHLVTDIKDSMNHYFRGQALVAFCVGILFCIGFLIIDFPMAIGLGLFIGLLNMVPYLQLVGFIPTILLALLKSADTGENFWWVMGMALLVFCVVQIIQDTLLTPKIMGKITGLNPAIILLSLSVWGTLMGILGMIIALPLTTLLLSYYQRYIRKKNIAFLSERKTSDNQQTEEVNE